MAKFTRTFTIHAPASEVFAALTNLDEASRFMPDVTKIERLDAKPLGQGSKWRETRTIKLFGFIPLRASAVIEVTDFTLNHHYTTVSKDNCNWAAYTFKLDETEEGTEVTLLGEFKCIGKYEGNEKKAQQMANFCEKADGDLLIRLAAYLG